MDTSFDEIDYLSIGGVFRTLSNSDTGPPIGIQALRQLVDLARQRSEELPIIAISGINEDNINAVLDCGVSGVAVVSAITESPSPLEAATRLRNRISAYRNQH